MCENSSEIECAIEKQVMEVEEQIIGSESEVEFDNILIENGEVVRKLDFEKEIEAKLSETKTYYEKVIEENEDKIKKLEEKCSNLKSQCDAANKEKELALKEKESTVIRYAIGEKNVLQEKHQKESFEKKYKEQVRENEILQHKVQGIYAEKARICQMLDNKSYEHKTVQHELDKLKVDFNSLETKLKWSQNSLKTELASHKECQVKVETLNQKLQEATTRIDEVRSESDKSFQNFQTSEENRAHALDQQLKELQASLILLKHERSDKDQQVKTLQSELERLQIKQKEMLDENNELSLKVQHLERDRLENEQKLSVLRTCADQQRQDSSNLQAKCVELEQIKLQLNHAQDQIIANNEQIEMFKQRNSELESDMESCRIREAELLLFTQQLTDKNVRLQSEFTAMETKVQQLSCEQAMLKRGSKELESKSKLLGDLLEKERSKNGTEISKLRKELEDQTKQCEYFKQEAVDQKGENLVVKRKLELSLKEVTKELQHCRKKIEQLEQQSVENTSSSSSSSTSNIAERLGNENIQNEQVKIISPDGGLNKQTLIEHIAKLQRISAKKSEKLDFLEEHVNTLVLELQKKTRLLQSYILREQTGIVTSNSMDNNKVYANKQLKKR